MSQSKEKFDRSGLSPSEIALLDLAETTISTGGALSGQVIRGITDIIASIARSPPISQAVAIAAGIAALSWFCRFYPNVTKFFHVEELCVLFQPSEFNQGLKTINTAADKCINDIFAAGFQPPPQLFQLRDTLNFSAQVEAIRELVPGIAQLTDLLVDLLSKAISGQEFSVNIEKMVKEMEAFCLAFIAEKRGRLPPDSRERPPPPGDVIGGEGIPPPPPEPAITVCHFSYRYKQDFGAIPFLPDWRDVFTTDKAATVLAWDFKNIFGAVGNLFEVRTCTFSDGHVEKSETESKHSTFHGDIN